MLVSLWGDKSVQSASDSAHQNRHIFEQIARDMSEKGYKRLLSLHASFRLSHSGHTSFL